jgi:hypothetical protein
MTLPHPAARKRDRPGDSSPGLSLFGGPKPAPCQKTAPVAPRAPDSLCCSAWRDKHEITYSGNSSKTGSISSSLSQSALREA